MTVNPGRAHLDPLIRKQAHQTKVKFYSKKREVLLKHNIISAFLNKGSTKKEKEMIFIYNKLILKDLVNLGGMYLNNFYKRSQA